MSETKFKTFVYLLTNSVISLMLEKEPLTEQEALDMFYTSEIYGLLEKESTKIWWLSPEALYEILLEERGMIK